MAAFDSVSCFSTGIRPHLLRLVSLHQQLSNLSVNIKLVNILGHSGLEGNDTADDLAKVVAHHRISAPDKISRTAAF